MRTISSRLPATLAGAAALCAAALPWSASGAGPAPRALKPIPAAIEPGSLTPVTLGELIFNDPSLSASGLQACASCHDKQRGHADPLNTFMPMGGPALDQQGHRSSMSLSYQALNPPFSFGPLGRPRGGYFWDGRANTLVDQAVGPLFNPAEMANTTLASINAKLQAAPYWAEMQRLYPTATRSSARNHFLLALQQAVAAYQQGDVDYALFNSKFDRVLDGTATFTPQEQRGLNIFNNPGRGNCASCHTSAPGPNGQRPLFTDQTYHALGLPRNMSIRANATDPNYYDMGLCGPDRTDLVQRVDLCGAFRVPTLRNVALTAPYFHNGASPTLTDAVSFYATRDINPARWYPLVNNTPDKFNDLPLGFRGNVVTTPPFGPLLPNGQPRLNAQDVADLVAFLNTLTDDTSAPRGTAFVKDIDTAAAALRGPATTAAAR